MSRLRSLALGVYIVSFTACTGLLCLGCGDTIVNVPTAPTPTPTPTPTPVPRNVVAFRVVGNATSVRVRYSTPADGVVQVLTTLPFEAGFSTTATTIFLSLEATPVAFDSNSPFAFFGIQIVVNDQVFREASSSSFLLQTLSVSGTWRQ